MPYGNIWVILKYGSLKTKKKKKVCSVEVITLCCWVKGFHKYVDLPFLKVKKKKKTYGLTAEPAIIFIKMDIKLRSSLKLNFW